MLTRVLLLVAFTIASLAASPARPQSDSLNRTVYVCSYNDLKTPNGESAVARTPPFAVPEGVSSEQVSHDWMAWYRAQNPQAPVHSLNARCSGTSERALKYVQTILNEFGRWTIYKAEWIPPYGVPYALPKHAYYYCSARDATKVGAGKRSLISDLFRLPMPPNIQVMEQDLEEQYARYLLDRGEMLYARGCSVVHAEAFQAYTAMLDHPNSLVTKVRSNWRGPGEVAAPNLIDDLAARAEYAKKRIMGTPQTAKTAPPPAPKPKPTAASASPGSLTVKTDTALRDAGKVWDEQVRKTLAEEAKKKVELAAKQAQANAKAKADLEAFLKARRKQGSAQ